MKKTFAVKIAGPKRCRIILIKSASLLGSVHIAYGQIKKNERMTGVQETLLKTKES